MQNSGKSIQDICWRRNVTVFEKETYVRKGEKPKGVSASMGLMKITKPTNKQKYITYEVNTGRQARRVHINKAYVNGGSNATNIKHESFR
mmetsp:Transcript_39002/g.44443  ORF Transcript_39002/g.44443 Transcript_39002/m.44443 type:complete len:90 (+) Transcript_39002:87-356(+)